MSIKCQDEYGDENERIVLSQKYWKSDVCLFVCLSVCLFVWISGSNAKMNMVIIMSIWCSVRDTGRVMQSKL